MSSPTVSTRLQRLAEQARQRPARPFSPLAYLIDVDLRREAYHQTRRGGAPGVDGVTAEEYAADLEANLTALQARLRRGRYDAPPVKRAYGPKEDGSQRPIGRPAFEDKVVQRAVAMLLGAIYEPDFHDCSYGFREGRSPHPAHASCRATMVLHQRGADTLSSEEPDALIALVRVCGGPGG